MEIWWEWHEGAWTRMVSTLYSQYVYHSILRGGLENLRRSCAMAHSRKVA
jgi:hypothetical protein